MANRKQRKSFKPLPTQFKAACPESCDFELIAEDGEGKQKRFSMTAYTGAAMNVGFGWPVVIDIAGVTASRQDMPILKGHDHDQIVGHSTEVSTSPQRIRASGVVSGVGDAATEVVALARNGFPWQASVGGSVMSQQFVDKGEKVTVNGRSFDGPLYVVRKFRLNEISFVSLGADGATSASVAASANKEQKEMTEFEKWLQAVGCDADHMTEDQLSAAQESFDRLQAAKNDGDSKQIATATVDLKAELAKMRDEFTAALKDTSRVSEIRALCAGKHDDIEAKAIKEGWSTEKTELEVLRASRGKVDHGGGPFKAAVDSNVLEAALCQAGSLKDIDSQFDEKTLDAAHKQYHGRLGLQEFLLEAAWQNGYDGRHFPRTVPGMKSLLQAAFSTVSLPGILGNTANKFLLMGFDAVESTWRNISAIRNVSDFKTVTSYRMTGDFKYLEVGPTGELKHDETGEESYTNAAKTYGRMYSITRTDMINDDLGALNDVPRRIGRGGALKLNEVFWTEFLSNPTNKNGIASDTNAFFSAAHGNYDTSGGVLDIDQLTAMEQDFFNQTDRDGNPLGLTASTLLVPNALYVTATLLMSSLEIRDNTASTKTATMNPHAGKFGVQRSSYISNAAITNNTTTGYWLLANPSELPVIETCFLNGQQSPTVETADADFNVLGIQMRGYHDFGVSLVDYRGGVFYDGTT